MCVIRKLSSGREGLPLVTCRVVNIMVSLVAATLVGFQMR